MRPFKYYITGVFLFIFSGSLAQTTEKLEKSKEQQNTLNNASGNTNFPTTPQVIEFEDKRSERTQEQEQTMRQSYFNRRAEFQSPGSKAISKTEQAELDKMVTELEKSAQNQYDFHYVAYINSNRSPAFVYHLQEAYRINPNSYELYKDFAAHYEMVNQPIQKKEFLTKIKATAQYTDEQYFFAHNLLASCAADNSVLFTYGNLDTYPLWVQQDVNGQHSNVKVLNVEMLLVDEYKTQLGKTYKLPKLNAVSDAAKYIAEFARLNPAQKVFVTSTFSPAVLKELNASLYLTGTVFRYSTTPVENIEELVRNWEDKFQVKSLEKSAHGSDAKLRANYLLALTHIQDYYRKTGKAKEADKLKGLALRIAKEAGVEDKYKPLLDSYGK